MGGFVGWIDFDRNLETEGAQCRAMAASLHRRGGDGDGVWLARDAALGQRRIALIDQADAARPLVRETEAGPVALVLAGAIDNHRALRRDLAGAGTAFETDGDAEVVLQAYLAHGRTFVDALHGSFALAIWDGRTGTLIAARDRFGVKPFYYHAYSGGLLFASTPGAILGHRRFEARLDPAALPILLQPRLALPGETPLIGLDELPPAHRLALSRDGLHVERYWRLTSGPHSDGFADTARTVRALLEEIVARQADVPVSRGAMLSGGLDSTSVAALAARRLAGEAPPAALSTYCVRFDTDAEHFLATELRPDIDAPYAEAAAAAIGTRHHTVTASADDLDAVIPETRAARDLPGWGQFDASMYLLFGAMAGDCRMVLTGEAADEVFGGYPYLFKPELVGRSAFPWLGDGWRLADYLAPDLRARIDPEADERARYDRLIAEVPALEGEDPGEARMREVLYLGMSGPLAVILDRKERMSAAHGLEVRVPFCDHRLVEYVWNVPWSMKAQGGVKGLLKAAMDDLLPAATRDRKKSAYPHIRSPAYDRQVIAEARRILDDPAAPAGDLFDRPRLRELVDRIDAAADAELAGRMLPGGAAPAHMLIHVVEIDRWIDGYKVSLA